MREVARPGDGSVGPPRTPLVVSRIRPAYEQIASQLRELIVQGALAPGDRMPVESELAAAFGVSRGTVREALRMLGPHNLVYAMRGASGGTFVGRSDPASLSEHLETGIGLLSGTDAITLEELLEARQLLEVPAARLAAERRTETHLANLRDALNGDSSPLDGSPRFQHHRRFHGSVLAAAGNRLIEVMTLPIFGVIRSRFVLQPSQPALWQEIDADHVEIFDLICDGDGEAAGEAMRQHLVRLNATYRGMEESRLARSTARRELQL